MHEEVLASVLANPRVEPSLAIWGWQIATYLFFGGLAGGMMLCAGAVILTRREPEAPFAAHRAPLVALVLLSAGLTTLFLDLERKINVLRFYTTFQVTSPMSWGSWILMLVMPALFLLALASLAQGFPVLDRLLRGLPAVGRPVVGPVIDLCVRFRRVLAAVNLALGIALCLYTGVLLSGFNARPFWHSALLGPLFLVSGLSTATAVMILGARTAQERHLFGRIDLGVILVEMALIGLFLIDMLNGTALQQAAAALLLGGALTGLFWFGFVALGLGLPLLLEAAIWRRPITVLASAASVLVLVGGFLLRDIVVTAGQQTGWTQFHNQFNAGLLDRLRTDGEDPNGRF